ncbi:MAG: hypothetical protein RLZ98_292 [Pseudomonadota bacterium]
MPFYYPATPEIDLPAGHRFPREKYRMLRERLAHEGIVSPGDLLPSPYASRDELLAAHAQRYVDAVFDGTLPADGVRRIGLPWSPSLVNRSRAVVGGALAAARMALETGISGQLAGGTHHAHHDFGAGFCVFNDLAVAARVLLGEGRVARVAILDVDVHQGDGNAAILSADPDVFVVSLHGEKNYPFRKVDSNLDLPLPDGADDEAFGVALEEALEHVAAFRPGLLLYLSGVDALASDRLGRLAMTHAGLLARDLRVFEFARMRALPVSIAIGGGYADPIAESVEAYVNTFRAAREVFG